MFTPGVSSRAIRVSACVITCRESNLDSRSTACATWEKRHTHEASIWTSHESPNRAKKMCSRNLIDELKYLIYMCIFICRPAVNVKFPRLKCQVIATWMAGSVLTMWPFFGYRYPEYTYFSLIEYIYCISLPTALEQDKTNIGHGPFPKKIKI